MLCGGEWWRGSMEYLRGGGSPMRLGGHGVGVGKNYEG